MLAYVTGSSLSRLPAPSFFAFLLSVSVGLAAPPPHAGSVIGVVDNIAYGSDGQHYLFGWACQQGNRGSIQVHLYAG
jgi:hypothetical protein